MSVLIPENDKIISLPVNPKVSPIKWEYEVVAKKLLIDVVEVMDDGTVKEGKRMTFRRSLFLNCVSGNPVGSKHYRCTITSRSLKDKEEDKDKKTKPKSKDKERKPKMVKYSVSGRKIISRPWWEGGPYESDEYGKNESMNAFEFVTWLAKLLGNDQAINAFAELQSKMPDE